MEKKKIDLDLLLEFVKTIYKGIVSIEYDIAKSNVLLTIKSKTDAKVIFEKLRTFSEIKNIIISNILITNSNNETILFYLSF